MNVAKTRISHIIKGVQYLPGSNLVLFKTTFQLKHNLELQQLLNLTWSW